MRLDTGFGAILEESLDAAMFKAPDHVCIVAPRYTDFKVKVTPSSAPSPRRADGSTWPASVRPCVQSLSSAHAKPISRLGGYPPRA